MLDCYSYYCQGGPGNFGDFGGGGGGSSSGHRSSIEVSTQRAEIIPLCFLSASDVRKTFIIFGHFVSWCANYNRIKLLSCSILQESVKCNKLHRCWDIYVKTNEDTTVLSGTEMFARDVVLALGGIS